MRSLKISLALFAALIICICANSLYIHRCADRLSAEADAIAHGGDVEALEDFWLNNKEYVGLSVSESQLSHISQLIVSIGVNLKHGERAALEEDLALLSDAAEGMRRHERLSIENIF